MVEENRMITVEDRLSGGPRWQGPWVEADVRNHFGGTWGSLAVPCPLGGGSLDRPQSL